ncbi:hypothetical protein [Roseateles sp.]|nr:hypothetical protein [Roseateles sp.]
MPSLVQPVQRPAIAYNARAQGQVLLRQTQAQRGVEAELGRVLCVLA